MSLNEGSTPVDNGGPSLSAEEEAFFTSGGESEIPAGGDAGADAGGGTGGGEGSAEKPAGGEKPDAGTPKNDHVPLATFLEEKKARKELATKYQETEKALAELRGKFAIIDRLKLGGEDPAATQQPAGPPAVEEDIFGAVKHVTETLAQIQKREADAAAAKEADEKAATEQKTFVDNYTKACNEFEKTTPDFKPAYDFLLNSRAGELRAIGYDTPEALHQALIADEFAIAQMAFERGKSPAELIYSLANQRGYKKASAPAADPKGDAAKAAADKLETIERGQAAHKSLSNTGGSSGDQDMTAEALIAMPAAEFETWCEKNPARARKLFGG
ncbi:hypothetical protein [Bradyrhizobium retamae]|uniref:Scaffolding protein n=1 Tax=Bradyrhizobium retamae TaxID=1300035 RepID=A0A0R3MPQ1_9BRAD|nr:hypothetical protein [Bradyrhizobium retamae]KRR21905.1 hypothetical protein CQ13_07670 [Bradyrhizobium retamae]